MFIRQLRIALPALTGALSCMLTPAIASPLDETVSVLEEWVQTERMISESESEWEASKASMENLISIYRREIDTLEEVIASAQEDTSAAEIRRSELNEQDEAVKAIEAQVVEAIEEAESLIKELQPLLPPPLQEELSPLFNSLPEDSSKTKLAIGQRIQPIVAILTQVQKFNQVVTVVEGFREFEAGRTVQTEKVFFGLGAAFYVDQADEHAGLGVLGENGWTWKDDPSLVPAIRKFISIYRGTQQASYVEVPVSVN
jgi:hypothetical protein